MTELSEHILFALREEETSATPVDAIAALVSIPPRASWRYVREVRRLLCGPDTLSLEFEFASSVHIDTSSPAGVLLSRESSKHGRAIMRRALSMAGAGVKEEVRELVRRERATLRPLLAIELDLVWSWVSTPNFADECERVWRDVATTFAYEDRGGIPEWVYGATLRLPPEVTEVPSASLLKNLLPEDHPARSSRPDPEVDLQLLRAFAHRLPTTLLPFRRDGHTIEFGPSSRSRRTALRVPAFFGAPIEISWREGEGTSRRHLMKIGDPEAVTVGTAELTLVDPLGVIHKLAAFDPGSVAPEIGELEDALDAIEEAFEAKKVIDAVIDRVRPGFDARASLPIAPGLRAVISATASPDGDGASIDGTYYPAGSIVQVTVVQFDRDKQRTTLEVVRDRRKFLSELSVGESLVGTLRHVTSYGAFVTLDGGSVLLHNAEIPASFKLVIGSEIIVQIFQIDLEQERASAALVPRRPAWVRAREGASRPGDAELVREHIADQLRTRQVGEILDGRVADIVNFGVFVEVDGVDGLLHRSEIPAGVRFARGDAISVRISKIEGHRLSFSMANPGRSHSDGRAADLEEARQLELAAKITRRALASLPFNTPAAQFAPVLRAALLAENIAPWPGYRGFVEFLRTVVPEHLVHDSRGEVSIRPGNEPPVSAKERAAHLCRQKLNHLAAPQLAPAFAAELRKSLEAEGIRPWVGYGSFKAFLKAVCPDAEMSSIGTPHWTIHPPRPGAAGTTDSPQA